MRNTFLSLRIACISVSAFSAPRQKAKVISGLVIAYSNAPLCLNGNMYWSMVIRAEPHNEEPARFVEVDFSYPCAKSPQSVIENSSIQRFHLIRRKELDSTLEGSVDLVEQQSAKDKPVPSSKTAKWTYLPANESFKLPFGEVLPRYYSVELPFVPVV